MSTTIKEIEVREVKFTLNTYNRSLDLCSRMNYEIENLDFIDEMAPGSVFYDLGACEGRFSIYAAKKGHQVYSFEPDSFNYKVFNENINTNGLQDKISAFNLAVGEHDGIGTLQIGQPWEGGHQKVVSNEFVREDLAFNFQTESTIHITSLDSIIGKENLPIPQYLKIDIDGSEMVFLKGAKQTLANPILKRCLFELDDLDKHYPTILKTMEEAGFSIIGSYSIPNEPNLFNVLFEKK